MPHWGRISFFTFVVLTIALLGVFIFRELLGEESALLKYMTFFKFDDEGKRESSGSLGNEFPRSTDNPTAILRRSPSSPRPTHDPTGSPSSSTGKPTTAVTQSPSSHQPSQAPTTSKPVAVNLSDPMIQQCMATPLKTLSDKVRGSVLNCSNNVVWDPEVEEPVLSIDLLENAEELLSTRVSMFDSELWGQMCNKMILFTHWFMEMERLGRYNTSLIAFHSRFTPPIYAWDMQKFSSQAIGVLLDCTKCDKTKNTARKEIRCREILVKGKLYDVSDRIFEFDYSTNAGDVWWYKYMRTKETSNALYTKIISPKPFLMNMVDQVLENHFMKEVDPETVTVGVHRRFMDRTCYWYILNTVQYHCAMNPDLSKMVSIAKVKIHDQNLKYYKEESKILMQMDDDHRFAYESDFPMIVACNFTLRPNQLEILNNTWPMGQLGRKWSVLLASDNQTPNGETAFRDSPQVALVKKLSDYEPCLGQSPYYDMLADMYALSKMDLHLENPVSSCGDVVAHWRNALNKPKGTSWPPLCYDGRYEQPV